jgi:hypothetical protein
LNSRIQNFAVQVRRSKDLVEGRRHGAAAAGLVGAVTKAILSRCPLGWQQRSRARHEERDRVPSPL